MPLQKSARTKLSQNNVEVENHAVGFYFGIEKPLGSDFNCGAEKSHVIETRTSGEFFGIEIPIACGFFDVDDLGAVVNLNAAEIAALMPYFTVAELAELEGYIDHEKGRWMPQEGPQTQAYFSEADIILYGGAAGGGKSDLLIGLAHQKHKLSIIFRPSYTEMKGLVRRSQAILEGKGKWNLSDFVYRGDDGIVIEYGAMSNLAMASKFQGQPHDFIGIDEGTNFSEETIRFVMGWLRSAEDGDVKQRCQVVIASNPPTSAKGDWVIEFFGPWLKADHPRPAAPGELRWFVRHQTEDRDLEVPGHEPFDFEGKRLVDNEGRDIKPLSRTFIPAKLGDNKYLSGTGYLAQLQSLPEPLRSKMLYGDFGAGREDDANQIIPVLWVKAAQERWKTTPKPSTPMTAIGCDIARGGRDKTILSPRYGNWFSELVAVPGTATKDGQTAAQLILSHAQVGTAINVDVIGIGSAAYDALTMNNVDDVYAMNASESSSEMDRSGRLGFVNKRAEWYWRMREALDPENGEKLCLPPDPELLADLCAPTWMLKARGIQVESKDDIKARIGRSPDRGDAAIYALANTQGGGYAVSVNRGLR